MTTVDKLAISLWRGHASTLHTKLHGAGMTSDATYSDEQYDRQYPPLKAAWTEGVRAVLTELRSLTNLADVQKQVDEILAEEAPVEDAKMQEAERKAVVQQAHNLPPGTQVT